MGSRVSTIRFGIDKQLVDSFRKSVAQITSGPFHICANANRENVSASNNAESGV